MVEGTNPKKVTTPKKETASKKGTTPKKESKPNSEIAILPEKPQPEKIEVKKETKAKLDKITVSEKPQLSEIDEKRKQFEHLLAKFQSMDDPIERYIKRQEMTKIQQYLKEYGIRVDLP